MPSTLRKSLRSERYALSPLWLTHLTYLPLNIFRFVKDKKKTGRSPSVPPTKVEERCLQDSLDSGS